MIVLMLVPVLRGRQLEMAGPRCSFQARLTCPPARMAG
jgi:hypothetical protein